jgi:hypothetical protein
MKRVDLKLGRIGASALGEEGWKKESARETLVGVSKWGVGMLQQSESKYIISFLLGHVQK